MTTVAIVTIPMYAIVVHGHLQGGSSGELKFGTSVGIAVDAKTKKLEFCLNHYCQEPAY